MIHRSCISDLQTRRYALGSRYAGHKGGIIKADSLSVFQGLVDIGRIAAFDGVGFIVIIAIFL